MTRSSCRGSALSLAGLWIVLSGLALPVFAQAPEESQDTAELPAWVRQVALNGYGTWYYGKTSNENEILGALENGSYETANFHLSLAAAVSERLRVVTQVEWRNDPDGSEEALDYVFAEWKLTSEMRVRFGKAKMPFGIYSEFPDVGTLRPFLELPQAAYGPIGFLGENYKGVGLTGSLGSGGWRMGWDVYGGSTELEEDATGEAFLLGEELEPGEEIESELTRDVIGGRLVVETPVSGLSFGASALSGIEEADVGRRRRVYGIQAEYSRDALTVRAETMHEEVFEDLEATGSYVEASYRFAGHWQVAAEAGHLRNEVFGIDPSGQPANLLEHDDLALGVNYWFDDNLVVKLNYMRIRGNLYAHPPVDELPEIIEAGDLQERTNVVLAGAQFSF